MPPARIQDQSGDELVEKLRSNQQGKGYGAEGTCNSGNYVYAVVYLYIPMKQVPDVSLSNFTYYNCSNAEVWKKSEHAFIIRATVTNDGGAGLEFNWSATI